MKLKRVSANISLGERLKSNAKAYAEGLDMDLSELVSHLLREEIANPTIAQKKPVVKAGKVSGASAGDPPSTGSTPSYRRVHPSEVALISEEPGSTPSEFLSVHSRK